jgi:hypothetical protein
MFDRRAPRTHGVRIREGGRVGSANKTLSLSLKTMSSVGCPTSRDFVPWRFSDALLTGAREIDKVFENRHEHRWANEKSVELYHEPGAVSAGI